MLNETNDVLVVSNETEVQEWTTPGIESSSPRDWAVLLSCDDGCVDDGFGGFTNACSP